MNKLIILLMAMLIFTLGSGIGAAKEITVNPTDSIRTAVNNAGSDDVIIVKPGVYNESIKITTPKLIIRSESGNPENTIIRTDSYGFYVTATASNTTISGFKIDSAETGITLDSCSGCTISNNEISGNRANKDTKFGIRLNNASGDTLLNNSLNLNARGIDFYFSNKNTIIDNIVLNNSQYGMWISVSNYNDISGNTVNGCGDGRPSGSGGIHLNSATGNIISGNIVAFTNTNGYGLFECRACKKNLLYNNYINNDRNADIQSLDTTWDVAKTNGTNIVGGPYIGGNFWGTPQGKGFSQVTPDNNKDGFTDDIYESGNIKDHLPLVLVSSPQQPILPVANFSANVTSGYSPLDVQFTDLSQNAVSRSWDFDNNGQQESNVISPAYTYRVPGNYTVNLTVSNGNGKNSKLATITALEQPVTVFPVADFSASVTSGYAPLDVQFTDLSQNATSRSWNFGDGSPLSTDQNPMHTFSGVGTYTVNLTAINENGTSQTPKIATIAVTQENRPSHSSGGGGGAGGSPEPAKNVEVKEISQAFITNGKPVTFDFAKEATCVAYVNFDSKKTAGKTTAIAEQLKGKSTLVSDLNAGEVYKYFNLWVGTGGFATSKNIENPVVCFKVDKSWLQDKNIDQASITLNRYSDKKWSQLPVKLLEEDGKYLYFTAETPEFSFFAITGKAGEKEIVTEIKPEIDTSKPEQNITASEIEQGQKSKQENITNTSGSDEGNIKGIPGFETLYAIAGILMVFLNKRKINL